MDSWKMFDHEDIQWTEATPDSVKEALAPTLEEKYNEKLVEIEVLVGNKTAVQALYCGDLIYYVQTGVDPKELAFLFSDFVIPLRDMLEALGYETTEVVKNV